VKILQFLDEIKANGQITQKVKTFEEDPRSRGAKWSMASNDWGLPEKRCAIEAFAAQEHAASLMRIDTTSRQKGKYVQMEKKLYVKFRERRARARKCSAKWFVHTARHIMSTEYPGCPFKGSDGWLRRMFKRFTLVPRKKTNVKNKTWEQTKPVLQRYFCGLRRRLRDTQWRAARTAVAAAQLAAPPAPAPAAAEPYPSFEAVDEAIKPLSENVSLWADDFPDTEEGNKKLEMILREPKHAEKLARLAATPCDTAETFSRRVVMCAKGIAAVAAPAVAPSPTRQSPRKRARDGAPRSTWTRTCSIPKTPPSKNKSSQY
jgi:hypothetical protein